jgi:DNA-binding CsgD family transcriptional regulator
MFDQIFKIRDFLNKGIVTSADAAELLSLLGRALDASATALATPLAWGDLNISDGIPSGWPEAYMRVRQWDPLIQRVCNPTVSSWVRGNEDLAHLHEDNPCADAFFSRFVDCLGLRVSNPYGVDHCFAIYRAQGKPKFTIDERNAMNLLVPHLSAALRTRTAERALRDPGAELREVVVLRYPERVAEWSPEARGMIRRALPGLSQGAMGKLDEVLFRAARWFYSHPGQASVPIVGSVRADFAVLRSPSQRALLAVLSDGPVRAPRVRRLPFEELLSLRERQIARSLSQGIRLEEAAAVHRISRETAKSHLKALYRKLAIRSRAELARLYVE